MPSSTGPSIDTITEGGRVTQVGEGQEAEESAPPVMTFGAPTAGEILAERYELVEHINNDSAGRLVWRGVDVVLRRPVAVVLRYPGGDSATEMLQAAVAASRVIHPNLVGVYDAIDEADRAYVVREWVDGQSVRELVNADGPLDPARATAIGNAVASALAAVHATGMVHGNVHPGTVMISDDGRVVLADARTDGADSQENDLRAVGGVLYFALTGHWPHGEAPLHGATAGHGRAAIPDAVRDAGGAIAAPRQVRAGVPAYLDDLTMDLLDPEIAPPSSDVLAAELGRLDIPADEHFLDQAGTLRFTADPEEEPSPLAAAGGRKVALGIAGLLAVALVGLLIGISALGGDDKDAKTEPVARPTSSAPADQPTQAAPVRKLAVEDVRIIDPDSRTRNELGDAEKVIDGSEDEGWETDTYKSAKFGGLKDGMGVWIDLGAEHTVMSVKAVLSASGATAQLYTGTTDPGSGSSGDKKLYTEYVTAKTRIGDGFAPAEGSTLIFSNGFDPDKKYRYLLFWLTELPSNDRGYKIGVQEITVQGS
ncbi:MULTISPECIES: protein kinase family protein [Micromonospora]|uniref:Protein kinase family protein n=1 Tax=Micromonospora sicca TaxID=2202420 RepID=A0A317DI64_9ACTN|nr:MULTISPECIES: protein kinase family protein [unclassified Micromonospora]MBM0228832.1 protein kinase family protein [Micromonospora sp. ATA51]MDZ5444171.1 protein kinase family protein [Micromonospora sp. 4G57]MDZ5489475.1 protein kinase family protein [Micromonospora sp. 4G53]PWR12525.1 serine/threonine protein kinase [Micromonospora sp. 4G51]